MEQDFNGIYLVGYSGHGRVVCDAALKSGIKILGYFEKNKSVHNPFFLEYFGSEMDLSDEFYLENIFSIGVGNNTIRKSIFNRIKKKEGRICTIYHPLSTVSKTAKIGEGSFLNAFSVLNSGSTLGYNTIVNTSAIIEHDCKVGSHSHIAPGAVLCGNVEIGENTLIGAGATIIEGIKIGSNSIIGAGSVVTKNIDDNKIVKGNPASE